MFQRGGTAMAMERFANLSDEVTEGRSSVRVEAERVERRGWTVNNMTKIRGLRGLKCVVQEF